jgi:hypothetical protein
MRTSEKIAEIGAALAKAQAELRNPAKNRENPHFKSKYADLAEGLDVIRPVLAKHGIAFVQATEFENDMVILRTRLIHGNQFLESSYPVSRLDKHQTMGASLTYAKRQALFSLVGVSGDDDDDGEITRKTPGDRWAPTRKALEASVEQVKRETSNSLKKNEPDLWPTIERKARAAKSVDELTAVWHEYEELYERMPQTWKDCMWEEFARLTSELEPVPA